MKAEDLGLSPQDFIPAPVRLHEQGRLLIDRLIGRYPFEAVETAAAAARSGASIKPVLVFG